ncbi:hypothetical protein ACMGE9_09920 [Macrococcus sp. EM39E]|uniref:hypothetical protein n=1 Tax=Macrococcus animalis TaxID=3395467 RepID=UPI0039BE30DC
MDKRITLMVTKLFLVVVYFLLLLNLLFWLYYMGQYVFHYEVITIKIFDIPYLKPVIILCLVCMAMLLEYKEKKLEGKKTNH